MRERRTRSRSWPRRGGGRASSTGSTSGTRSSSSARSRSRSRSRLPGGEPERVAQRRPRTRAAAEQLPRRMRLSVPAPSRRSLAIGCALVALAGGAYAVARETSAFAIRHVEVIGGSPKLRANVRKELASLRGTNLLALDGTKLGRRVAALPWIVSSTYDRAFPSTLRIAIVPEPPVAVLHRGTEIWLVSARARVIARLVPGARPLLPRIWVPTA